LSDILRCGVVTIACEQVEYEYIIVVVVDSLNAPLRARVGCRLPGIRIVIFSLFDPSWTTPPSAVVVTGVKFEAVATLDPPILAARTLSCTVGTGMTVLVEHIIPGLLDAYSRGPNLVCAFVFKTEEITYGCAIIGW
jgi:hypothetical protein